MGRSLQARDRRSHGRSQRTGSGGLGKDNAKEDGNEKLRASRLSDLHSLSPERENVSRGPFRGLVKKIIP